MTFEELEKKVRQWGVDRDLFNGSSARHQCDKLYEEYKELYAAVVNDEHYGIVDGIGDMIVVLTMIAKFNNVSLTSCYESAYNEIKDRKGKIVKGLFVKEL